MPIIDILEAIYLYLKSMVEEIAGLEEGNVREQVAEVSEDELVKVRDTQQQAKQVRQQIYTIQQTNQQYAWMLSLLLQYVTNETLLISLFAQMHTYSCSVPAVFAQMTPFLQERTDLDGYVEEYKDVASCMSEYSTGLTELVAYLSSVRSLYPELTNQPISEYVQFVIAYVEQLSLIDRTDRDDVKNKEFEQSLLGQI